MERAIYLHGNLAKRFGKDPVMINAPTTLLVMQGLICRFGYKFKQAIRDGSFYIFKNKRKDKDDLGEEEVGFTLGDKVTEMHLVPVIQGQSAIARIVLGVCLLVIGYFFPPLAPYLYPMGASMILGGVAELLTATPKLTTGTTQQAGTNPSFLFNGTVNVTEQGGPVPVILGRVRRASSVVLSAGLTVENMAL